MSNQLQKFLAVAALSYAVYWRYNFETSDFYTKIIDPIRCAIPKHLLSHPVIVEEGLISETTAQMLLGLIYKQQTFDNVINADLKRGAVKATYEHIGEATPQMQNGGCAHPFLTPAVGNNSECVLPGRVDVGRHFVQYGGPDAMREGHKSMVNRLSSFFRYHIGMQSLNELSPDIKGMFEDEKFKGAATAVCPKHKQFLDPFQFNFVIQVPGQTVALHTDAPYFWGASRQLFPQWLLVVMTFSNLFKEQFIDQVQVVAYLSKIDTTDPTTGGQFLFYRDNEESGEYDYASANYRAGNAVDGSKVVHAARIYRPSAQVPTLPKDKESTLVYSGQGEEWLLQLEGKTIATYKTDDLRISIVYRARCFAHEEERDAYHAQTGGNGGMQLEGVLRKLVDKMDADEHEGGLFEGSKDNDRAGERKAGLLENSPEKRLQLAIKLMDHYIRYPLPTREAAPTVPLNYCALPKLLPGWLGGNLEIC